MRAKEKGRNISNLKIEAKVSQFSLQFRQDATKRNVIFTLSTTKGKRPCCSKSLEERSEAKGISPTLSKSKVKRIRVFQKISKTKQNESKPFKIVQDRNKMNVFVSDCEEEEKRKKTKLRFFRTKAKKNEYNHSSTIEDLPLLGNTCLIHHLA